MSSAPTTSFHEYSGSVGEALGRLESQIAEAFGTIEAPELQLMPGTVPTFGSVKRRSKVDLQALPECLQVRKPPVPTMTPSPTHLQFSGSVGKATSRLQVQPNALSDSLIGEPGAHALSEGTAVLGNVRRREGLGRAEKVRIASRATSGEEHIQEVKVSPNLPSRKLTAQFAALPAWKQRFLRMKRNFRGGGSRPKETRPGPGPVEPTTTLGNEGKSSEKPKQFILDRTTIVLRKGVFRRVLRRRKSLNNRDPDAHTYSRTQATEGQYLPFITTTIPRPKVVEIRGSPNSPKLPRQNSHVLKPCGHTILTHHPSRCGRNCACKVVVETNVSSEKPSKSHPCVGCIENHLDAKYTAKSDTVLQASRPVLEPILGEKATNELLAKQLKTYGKIWHAERSLNRRNMLVNQAEANGMKRNSIGYILDNATPGDVGGKSIARPSSAYRGLDRSENLSNIRTQVHDSRRFEAWKVARRRSLTERHSKNERSSARKLTLSVVMDEAVNREFWVDDEGEWQVQQSVV